MGIELLLLYMAALFLLGPGMVVYGVVLISRKQVRVTARRVLNGDSAILAGFFCVVVGVVFTALLWDMRGNLPH
jgi:hypothetical protein